jgi:hypothetical protein
MDIDLKLRYTLRNSTPLSEHSENNIVDAYEVVWSGTQDTQHAKAQQRSAPTTEEQKGNRPAYPAGFGHAKEDRTVIDLRMRWQREEQKT